MNGRERALEKLSLLKHEISILNDRLSSVTSNIWKERQLALTLWLAVNGVSFGMLARRDGYELIVFLAILSILIPVLFWYIDARLTKWYGIYKMRDIEIQRFLSQENYVLPATDAKISLDDCLGNDSLPFPVYDLGGKQTFGASEAFRFRTSLPVCFFADTPLFYYGAQLFGSVLFLSLVCSQSTASVGWYCLPCLVLVLLFTVFVFRRRKLRNYPA